jgi:hypothetical protein
VHVGVVVICSDQPVRDRCVVVGFVVWWKEDSSPSYPVYASRVDSSTLVFSLSSHRHSYIGLIFTFRFIDS